MTIKETSSLLALFPSLRCSLVSCLPWRRSPPTLSEPAVPFSTLSPPSSPALHSAERMATAAFKSTTKRSPLGGATAESSTTTSRGSSSSSIRRRARSVSRFSHRLPSDFESSARDPVVDSTPDLTRGKLVNSRRGAAELPEISLDDLAIELFSSSGGGFSDEREGRGGRRSSEVSSSQKRGRSVSRQSSMSNSRVGAGGERKSVVASGRAAGPAYGGGSRRRRSLSVVRCQASDSESDYEHPKSIKSRINGEGFGSRNKQNTHKPAAPDQPRGLRRCSSQRDLLRSHDGYSIYSSALTDDEHGEGHYGSEGFTESSSVGFRDKVRVSQNPSGLVKGDDVQSQVTKIRRSYSSKLELLEKRKQELLAEVLLEEQHGQELKKIAGELLPEPKDTSPFRTPSRCRKRSNDSSRIPKQFNEDVDKIIEDFISSVEDNTDRSSFDEDRSDTSSMFGLTSRSVVNPMHTGEIGYQRISERAPLHLHMDGVVYPWLQWDSSNDSSLPSKDKRQNPGTPKTVLHDALEEMRNAHEHSTQSDSSRGSWSSMLTDSFSAESAASNNKILPFSSILRSKGQILLSSLPKRRSRVIGVDDYLTLKNNEEFILERWNQRERISSGGVLLCGRSSYGGGMFLL